MSSDGRLNSIGSSPYPDHQTAACWVEITHNGRYLFAVNTAVPSISRYRIWANGSLHLLGSTGFHQPTGLEPARCPAGPDGGTLWVVDSGTAKVSGFTVHGGHLSELGSSPTPLPSGAKPFGIVAT